MGKRMFYVLKIIQNSLNKEITGKDILEKLQDYDIYVDIKTVYACIKYINEFFYEILGTDMILSRKKKGFYIDEEIFSDGQLQFLIDSITFHEDLNYDDKLKLKNQLFNLSSFQQRQRIIESDVIDKKQSFSLILNLSTVTKAIENNKVISFQYINYDVEGNSLVEIASEKGNEGKQYILSPYEILSVNNHYYLIGYNNKYKNRLSTYRIDRMRFIKTTAHHFKEIREQFDMNVEINKMMNMYSSDKRDTLQIECEYKALREVVSRFGNDIKANKLIEDKYLITINDVSISEGLIGWLFMMQNQVKVITPVSLKEDIRTRLKQLNELYES